MNNFIHSFVDQEAKNPNNLTMKFVVTLFLLLIFAGWYLVEMILEVAQSQNNEELLEFYRSFPLDGLIHLRLDRGKDFFKYYGLQSELWAFCKES